MLNRGNGRADVFQVDGDFAAFLQLMADARVRFPMRILGYVLMHNHVHLVLRPRKDGALRRWVGRIARRLGLESTLRPRGRPRKYPTK